MTSRDWLGASIELRQASTPKTAPVRATGSRPGAFRRSFIVTLNPTWQACPACLSLRYNGEEQDSNGVVDSWFACRPRRRIQAISDSVELYARIENLFDEEYQQILGLWNAWAVRLSWCTADLLGIHHEASRSNFRSSCSHFLVGRDGVCVRDTAANVVSLDYCADQYVLKLLLPRARILALSPDAEELDFSYMRDAAASGIHAKSDPVAENVLMHRSLTWSYPFLRRRPACGQLLLESAGVPVLQVPFANKLDDIRECDPIPCRRVWA